MRKLIVFVVTISLSWTGYLFMQDYSTTNNIKTDTTQAALAKTTVVNLITPQKFHLNSLGKTMISGKNDVILLIELPENTVEWYYYVCATKENTTSFIQLAAQMSVLMVKRFADVTKIKVNEGNSYCNVYLLSDEKQKDFYLNKKEFNYLVKGSRENFTSGIIKGESMQKYNWLVIRNPRKAHAVDVVVEVVAIVDKSPLK